MWPIVWTLCVGFLVGSKVEDYCHSHKDKIYDSFIPGMIFAAAIVVVVVGIVMSVAGYPVYESF